MIFADQRTVPPGNLTLIAIEDADRRDCQPLGQLPEDRDANIGRVIPGARNWRSLEILIAAQTSFQPSKDLVGHDPTERE